MLLYKIDFEVDNGASYTKDNALIMAHSKEEAEEKLKKHISSLDHETCVSEIFKTTIFAGDVFTGQHGFTNKLTIL